MQFMSIEDSKRFCLALSLDLSLAFKNSRFILKSQVSTLEFRSTHEYQHEECKFLYDCFEEISALTDYDDRFLDCLLSNNSFSPLFNPQQAFILAAGFGCIDLVQFLINHPQVNPAFCCNFAVWIASFSENIDVLRILLKDSRVDPSDNDNNAFIAASSNGAIEVMELLLQDGRVDPSARGNYAIIEASSYGEFEIVERLLHDSRVDPSVHDNLAIRLASQNGKMNVVNLLSRYLGLDFLENTSQNLKSRNCYESVVESLLQDNRVSENTDSYRNYNNFGNQVVGL